jgi:hypothetical protein
MFAFEINAEKEICTLCAWLFYFYQDLDDVMSVIVDRFMAQKSCTQKTHVCLTKTLYNFFELLLLILQHFVQKPGKEPPSDLL